MTLYSHILLHVHHDNLAARMVVLKLLKLFIKLTHLNLGQIIKPNSVICPKHPSQMFLMSQLCVYLRRCYGVVNILRNAKFRFRSILVVVNSTRVRAPVWQSATARDLYATVGPSLPVMSL